MKRIFILFAIISFTLVGCSQGQKTQTVTTSSSLHNYDYEMITAALKNHLDFPKLTTNETLITKEVIHWERTSKVAFSWKTEIKSHGSTTKTDQKKNNTEISTEDASVDYYIILMKEWETDKGNGKSYWKYKYIPQTNEIKLVESEDNDNVVH